MAERALLGPLNGKFKFCKQKDGTVNRTRVACVVCSKEFANHRSCSNLNYHINAKHPVVAATSSATANDNSLTVNLHCFICQISTLFLVKVQCYF